MFCMHWFIRIALFRPPTAGLHQKMVSICYAGLLLAPLSVTRVSLHFHGLGDDDGDVNESGKKAIREIKSHVSTPGKIAIKKDLNGME